MTAEDILEYNILCAEFLGWKKTTEQFKIDWVGCQTKERLERLNEEYIPILEKNGNVIFPDFSVINFYSDWNWIMEVIEAIEKLNYYTKNECIRGVNYFNIYELENNEEIFYGTGKSKKEAVAQSINPFLIWYNKKNK